MDDKCREFAKHIRDVFADGLCINNKDNHFILSNLPIAHLNEINELIQDPDSAAYDTLMALIYFPGESIQIRLEDHIESARFDPQDDDTILSHLMALETVTHVLSPQKQLLVSISTPPSGASAFLQRLNLSLHLDFELIQAIETTANPMTARQYKVWIRNMTRKPIKRDIEFLKNLFLKLAPPLQSRDRLIKFALRFLEETQVDVDPLPGLIQYKQRCLQHIQRLDRFETNRLNHNFETRMALGIREPHDDRQALMQKLELLDEIGLAIYNRNI